MSIKSLLPTTARLSTGSPTKASLNVPLNLGRHTIKIASDAQPGLVSVANPLRRSSPKNHTLQQRTIQQPTHQHALQPRLSGKEWNSFQQQLPKNPLQLNSSPDLD